MKQPQRIARINVLLRQQQGVTMAQLMEDLSVSRATVNRDLDLMRDQMHAPIVWDRDTASTVLKQRTGSGRRTCCQACGSRRSRRMPS